MQQVKTILLSKSVFEDNDARAEKLRSGLKEKNICLVNVMSSPGSGKTTLLISLINALKQKYNIGVMEADIDSDKDAVTVAEKTGVRSIQLHTGGMCHLDADMTKQGLDGLGDGLDLIFLENVGNLVCPAEYDTGANVDMVILSVPEGNDKPLKYPLVFQKSDLAVISKTDALPYFNFNMDECREYIRSRNPDASVIAVSAKTGENMDELVNWFIRKLSER
ncbi:MAG: hydrogenase nickel incorporation protein HypB [Clostridia bacterium]|nr:hydrogenase nickel incorporation protein HypB [Clostridia bacterium]